MLKAKKAHALLDHLKDRFGLRNDRELAAALRPWQSFLYLQDAP